MTHPTGDALRTNADLLTVAADAYEVERKSYGWRIVEMHIDEFDVLTKNELGYIDGESLFRGEEKACRTWVRKRAMAAALMKLAEDPLATLGSARAYLTTVAEMK